MSRADLLVELLCEELPPKALNKLSDAFASGLIQGLRDRGFLPDAGSAERFASPRRLAVLVGNVASASAPKPIEHKLMPVAVGLDAQGRPTPALVKKLAALGFADTDPASLLRKNDGKADVLVLAATLPPVALVKALQEALDEAIAALPIPKVMTYQLADGVTDVKFVRPVHALMALHGDTIVPVQAFGHSAGRITAGHRFMSSGVVSVASASDYATTLAQHGKVMASFVDRREAIRAALAANAHGAHVIAPHALLDEVTALVEWPAVYAGTFDAAFLEVPQECLILTMQLNQKYFALADKPLEEGGKLTNRFLLVSNLETDDAAAIIGGNERVLRARLADAKFFFDFDRRQKLEARVETLANVVYHNKLGSQADRVQRLMVQAAAFAEKMGAPSKEARRAAKLAKADLMTDMVGEFPELQGLMGRYYASHDGEAAVVAEAIEQHYRPRFAGDVLPETGVGQALALADKLDTLVGIFGVGQKPTGDKDPFGLRRCALGVIRIIVETPLALDVGELIDTTIHTFQAGLVASTRADVLDFLHDRLRFLMRESGYEVNEVEAVVGQLPTRFDIVPAKLKAVRAFRALPEAESLAAANKRVQNILKKSGQADGIDTERLAEPAEKALASELHSVVPKVYARLVVDDYTEALRLLSSLRAPVDAFFDTVLVNAEDEALRRNRLALLTELSKAMNGVADIGRLAA